MSGFMILREKERRLKAEDSTMLAILAHRLLVIAFRGKISSAEHLHEVDYLPRYLADTRHFRFRCQYPCTFGALYSYWWTFSVD